MSLHGPLSFFRDDCRKTKSKEITEPITSASEPPFSVQYETMEFTDELNGF